MRIIYFEKKIHNLYDSISYKIYNNIINQYNQKPIIYSDNILTKIDNHIPTFHTYYLRNFFHQKIIITKNIDMDAIDNDTILSSSYIIVLYDRTKERIQKIKNDKIYFCDLQIDAVKNIIEGILS